MAQPIPEQRWDTPIQTGQVLPYASPQQTGAELGAAETRAGENIEHGARMLAIGVNRMQQDARIRQNFTDTRWVGDAYEQEKRLASEFMADPKNNSKESFATDLDQHFKDRMSQYNQGSAPSPRALAMFQERFSSLRTDAYDHALDVSSRNAVNGTINSIGGQINDAMQSYHNGQKVNSAWADHSMMDSVAHISTNIEETFRDISPKTADSLRDNLTTQAVMATMTDKPALARSLLNHDTRMDEQDRFKLNKEIDRADQAQRDIGEQSFNSFRKDTFARMENGQGGEKIPMSLYRSFYPDDQANALKSRDDDHIDILSKSNDTINKIQSWNAQEQTRYVNDLHSKISGDVDSQVYDRVLTSVISNQKMQDKDPAGWLQMNNPVVTALAKRVQSAPDDQKAGALKALNEGVLRFQGAAPPGATTDERKQYLDRPLNDRHLLMTDEATRTASDLNISTPKEFTKKMHEVMVRYPGEQSQYVAFNDLATVPPSGSALKQEYQLAWQNKDAWWLDNYLGALQAGKDIKLPEETTKAVDQYLKTEPTWLAFQNAMIGDNFQRSGQIAGFQEGIRQYSHALIAQGNDPKSAVQKSVSMLIGETLGITRINGNPMVIVRDQGIGMPRRTDDEVRDVGRRLSIALSTVDPRRIDQSNFTALNIFGNDEQHVPRLQALRDQITARGFFQTGQDGQSASLYMRGDDGTMFEVRDRNNQPLNINFKDLPKFQGEPRQVTVTGQIPKSYPLVRTVPDPTSDYVMDHTVTNWPSWLKHE